MEWALVGLAGALAVAVGVLAGLSAYAYRYTTKRLEGEVARERELANAKVMLDDASDAAEAAAKATEAWRKKHGEQDLQIVELVRELAHVEKERDHLIKRLAEADPAATADAIRHELRALEALRDAPAAAPQDRGDPGPGRGPAEALHGPAAGRPPIG